MVLVGSSGACLEFKGPIRSIIQVFQHPVTVDRWIIIFLEQNNWNDSGLTNLDGTKETRAPTGNMLPTFVCTLC